MEKKLSQTMLKAIGRKLKGDLNISIQWNWSGKNRHGILFYDGTEYLFAFPISNKKAEILINLGMNHGS